MRLSLETGAVLDGPLSRYLRTDCGAESVMCVREKCDEKVGSSNDEALASSAHYQTVMLLKN